MAILSFPERITALDAPALARRLIGATLVVRDAGGVIIETEAYARQDPASHSFRGPTARNASMFGPAGHAYVYRAFGIHLCLNVVAQPGEAVLIRALEPRTGLDLMRKRRGSRALCNGPGRLTEALAVHPDDDGKPFDQFDFSMVLASEIPEVRGGPRFGISKAQNLPWRFGRAVATGLNRPFPE